MFFFNVICKIMFVFLPFKETVREWNLQVSTRSYLLLFRKQPVVMRLDVAIFAHIILLSKHQVVFNIKNAKNSLRRLKKPSWRQKQLYWKRETYSFVNSIHIPIPEGCWKKREGRTLMKGNYAINYMKK